MAKVVIENLLTQLHDTFGDKEPSKEVVQLMMDMETQMEPSLAHGSLLASANQLLAQVESEHPDAVAIVRKIIETLNNIGV